MLISKLLEEYLRNKILAPDTVKSYREKTTHLIREVGDIDVNELSVDNLIDYRNKVMKSTSASTYNTLHRHLSAIFQYGMETGVVASSPFRVVRKAPVHHELPKVIQREKLSLLFQLLDHPEHPWPPCMRPIWFWRAFIKTLYFTGMRRRQILNLEWRDRRRTTHYSPQIRNQQDPAILRHSRTPILTLRVGNISKNILQAPRPNESKLEGLQCRPVSDSSETD